MATASDASSQLDQVKTGYAFDGPALEFGAAVSDGTAQPEVPVRLPLGVMNRHGLVAGATGTGKTKTLQLMAEQLSGQGVPVFLADIKGDLSGMATAGVANEKVAARAKDVGQEWLGEAYPTEFLSLGGVGNGIPIRATVTSFGPTLLSKVLGLNETQESSLGLVFHFADSQGLALLDIKDLREVIAHLTSDEGKEDLKGLGGLSTATAGVILRNLIAFSDQGAEVFFGEPEFDTADLMRVAADGKGMSPASSCPPSRTGPSCSRRSSCGCSQISSTTCPRSATSTNPSLSSSSTRPTCSSMAPARRSWTRSSRPCGSSDPRALAPFVTQTPKDVPSGVLAQLGNRAQHALRAFTPEDAKALKATVSTFPNSGYDLEELLTQLGTGEAVITVLSERGAPTPVAWTRMRAPQSTMAPSPDSVVQQAIAASSLKGKYAEMVDRESAYEKLKARMQAAPTPDQAPASDPTGGPAPTPAGREPKAKESMVEQVVTSSAFKSMLRSAGTVLGREITRSIFGTARRGR